MVEEFLQKDPRPSAILEPEALIHCEGEPSLGIRDAIDRWWPAISVAATRRALFICRRAGLIPENAEDAVSETCLSLLSSRSSARFSSEGHFHAYVNRSLANRLKAMIIEHKRMDCVFLDDLPPDFEIPTEDAFGVVEVLEAVASEATEDELEILRLAATGLTEGEAAEILGIPRRTFGDRLQRARERLGEALGLVEKDDFERDEVEDLFAFLKEAS